MQHKSPTLSPPLWVPLLAAFVALAITLAAYPRQSPRPLFLAPATPCHIGTPPPWPYTPPLQLNPVQPVHYRTEDNVRTTVGRPRRPLGVLPPIFRRFECVEVRKGPDQNFPRPKGPRINGLNHPFCPPSPLFPYNYRIFLYHEPPEFEI